MKSKAKFYLQTPKKPLSSIRCQVSFNGKVYKHNIGESVITRHWDAKKQKANLTSTYRDALIINHTVSELSKAVDRMLHNTAL